MANISPKKYVVTIAVCIEGLRSCEFVSMKSAGMFLPPEKTSSKVRTQNFADGNNHSEVAKFCCFFALCQSCY